jgi:diaminopimelate decarboxylase
MAAALIATLRLSGKDNEPAGRTYDVTGSLCENNDKFAIDRKLPKVNVGIAFGLHDTGAHEPLWAFTYSKRSFVTPSCF